jgi:hypothetical protein
VVYASEMTAAERRQWELVLSREATVYRDGRVPVLEKDFNDSAQRYIREHTPLQRNDRGELQAGEGYDYPVIVWAT